MYASEIEGNHVDYSKVLQMINDLKSYEGPVIIEGCGGLMVPLTKKFQILDLIKDSDLDLLIVSSLGLGCLNHTQLTLQIAESNGIRVSGIILNDVDGVIDISKKRNPQAIKELCTAPLIGVFPYIPDLVEEHRKEHLIKASSSLDLEKLKI